MDELAPGGFGPSRLEGPSSVAVISLDVVRAALKRRRRVWIVAAGLGFVVGALLPIALPQPERAQTTLYVAIPTGADPDRVMQTNLTLLRTRTVATSALQRLSLRTSPDDFLRTYTATSPSSHIVSLVVQGPTEADAVRRANAVAAAYLGFLADQANAQSDVTIQALQTRLSTLQEEISKASASIDGYRGTSSNAGTASASALQDLVTKRSNDISEASQISAAIQDAQLKSDEVAQGSRVVDAALPVRQSSKKALVIDGVAGMIAGLAIAVSWIAVAAITSDRVRRREDVAAALGVGLSLSTPRLRLPRLAAMRRLRAQLRAPSGALELIADHVAYELRTADRWPATAAVVAVDDDVAGALVTAAAARALAVAGRRVRIEDLTEEGTLARLVGLPRAGRDDDGAVPVAIDRVLGADVAAGAVVARRPSMAEVLTPDPELGGAPAGLDAHDVDVLLVVATLDPGRGADHLARWANEAIVVITAGRSTATAIANAGAMLAEAGIAIRSAVLTGADRTDDSLGSVPESSTRSAPLPGLLADAARQVP